MTYKEAIENLKRYIEELIEDYGYHKDIVEFRDSIEHLENVIKKKNERLTELEKIEKAHRETNGELRKELQLKEKIVRDIVKRLDNDIKNITETKANGYTDDYRRCRLNAYRTKTREIKEYIEEKYFTKKASDNNG